MEKYDDEDILEDYKDEITTIRVYNKFPGFFTKMYNKYDQVVEHSKIYTVVPLNFVDTPCYQFFDAQTSTYAQYITIGQIIVDNVRYVDYLSKQFDFYEVLGVKVQACASSDSSPFDGLYTNRITYPPLHLTLIFENLTLPSSLTIHQQINMSTNMIVPNDGTMYTKSMIIPNLQCAKYKTPQLSAGLNLWLYAGGYITVPTVDLAVSEAYQVIVTVVCGFKGATHRE